MARAVNYDQKISALEAKIEKKIKELKVLKAQLNDLEEKKTKNDFKTLNEFLAAKGISPEDAMKKLKEAFGE